MKITILGCGTSTGVPLIHCGCRVCKSRNPKNNRLRASIWIQRAGKSLLVDTSTDLRQQALREKIQKIDAVCITHPHADHIGGMDELRSFNFVQRARIPVYGNTWTTEALKARFPYIFTPSEGEGGGGIPLLDLHTLSPSTKKFRAASTLIQPIPLQHGTMECLGYRVKNFAYATDFQALPADSIKKLQDLEVLILDCLRLAPHGTHLHLEMALNLIEQVRPKKALLTHLGHDFDYGTWNRKLPKGVGLAFDGMKISVDD